MAKKVEGAKRSDAFVFVGDEVAKLAVLPQVRWETQQGHVDKFIRTLATGGSIPPVLIRKLIDGSPQLVDGRHRRLAVIELIEHFDDYKESYGEEFKLTSPPGLPAYLEEMDDDQALIAALRGNEGLRSSPIDSAYVITTLRNHKPPYEDKRIAYILRIAPSLVSVRAKYIHLPDNLKRAVHGGAPEQWARVMSDSGITDSDLLAAECELLLSGEKKIGDFKRAAADKKRAAGKKIVRTVDDLLDLCRRLETVPAMLLSRWMSGDPAVETAEVESLFAGPKSTVDDEGDGEGEGDE